MNEDVLNVSVRKFLKKVGITSQREIEQAVRAAVSGGKLKGNEALPAKVVPHRRRHQPIGGDRRRHRARVNAAILKQDLARAANFRETQSSSTYVVLLLPSCWSP